MRKGLILLTFLVALLCVLPLSAAAKGWETLKVEREGVRHIASDSEIEIKAARGVLYVNTTKSVNIKIYSILGSQITNDTLAAGSYQLLMPAHGVYIVKAGDLTCKVAL